MIDAREFYVKMRKSLGNKRKQIGDGEENRPDQIGEISRIYGNFMHDETRMTEVDGVAKRVVVSKIFDNTDFGYNKITVERPLRHVYNFSDSRIGTFDPTSKYYSSIISLVRMVEKVNENSALDYQTFLSISGNSWLQHTGDEKTMHQNAMFLDLIVNKYLVNKIFKSFDEYSSHIQDSLKNIHVRLAADAMALLGAAFEEKSAEGLPVKARGKNRKISDFEPDPDLRDTENVPLKENIEAYFAREVLPHVPDAWIDHGKTKVGYEIPLNRHFYCYEPPRALEDITADVKALEREIVAMLAGITGSAEGLK